MKYVHFRNKNISVKNGLWIVLVSTLLLKVVVVLVNGAAYDLHSDDRAYLQTAEIWLAKGMFTYLGADVPTVFIMPGLPAFIAVVMKMLGPGFASEQAIRILQAVMVNAALYILFLIGKRLMSEKAALAAVILSAFYPPLWLVSNYILTEAMFVLALMLLVYSALRAMERPLNRWTALFALSWVFATYVRPTIGLWPGLFFLLLLYWRKIPLLHLVKCGFIAALVFVLCLSPWWIRNYQVTGGSFVPLTKSGGSPLFLGTFRQLPSLQVQRTWYIEENPLSYDQFYMEKAVHKIKTMVKDTPLTFLYWYTIGKFSVFWGSVYYWTPIPYISITVVVFYHYLVILPGFLGMWLLRKNHQAAVIMMLLFYMSVLHMIYFANGRYSVPLMPLVILFAAYFLDKMVEA